MEPQGQERGWRDRCGDWSRPGGAGGGVQGPEPGPAADSANLATGCGRRGSGLGPFRSFCAGAGPLSAASRLMSKRGSMRCHAPAHGVKPHPHHANSRCFEREYSSSSLAFGQHTKICLSCDLGKYEHVRMNVGRFKIRSRNLNEQRDVSKCTDGRLSEIIKKSRAIWRITQIRFGIENLVSCFWISEGIDRSFQSKPTCN